MLKSPNVSIIILNWNGISDTLECLDSVYRIEYDNFSVVVVDNGSEDDSCLEIHNNYPQVDLIENNANLGFAEGNNVGIRHALQHGADYLFLLNNDTIVDPQILNEFLKASRNLNNNGIFGAKIYHYSEPTKIWYAGAKWHEQDCLCFHLTDDLERDIQVTDYACGCALFLSAAHIKKIGLLDPRFFLTFEEVDWCYRAKRFGINSYCVSNAKVWHKISASFGGNASPMIRYFLSRNVLLWGEHHLSLLGYARLVCISIKQLVWISDQKPIKSGVIIKPAAVRLMLLLIKQIRGEYPSLAARIHYLGLRDYFFRKFGECPPEVKILCSKR